ncbi:baculoviral IAP repeat-containing protein 7-like [Haliotis rufescens]|uniref:baculoviral IAP repeat-containing protein 7-like n=1 Tax=Haliotis rufescens TaxID=6454 RepID=UPI001EB0213D|nr:baculoviral IAP repeat-containing protein 7-like [Haliotis rufescens]
MAEMKSCTDACEGTMILLGTEGVNSCGPRSDGTDTCESRSECTDACDGRLPPPSKPPSLHLHFERRLASFEGWPMQMNQTAEEMAHGAFVYTKSADGVYCSHCDVRPRRWVLHDDPWLEHLKWSSHYAYLKLTGLVRHKKKNVAVTTFWHYLCEENANQSNANEEASPTFLG